MIARSGDGLLVQASQKYFTRSRRSARKMYESYIERWGERERRGGRIEKKKESSLGRKHRSDIHYRWQVVNERNIITTRVESGFRPDGFPSPSLRPNYIHIWEEDYARDPFRSDGGTLEGRANYLGRPVSLPRLNFIPRWTPSNSWRLLFDLEVSKYAVN